MKKLFLLIGITLAASSFGKGQTNVYHPFPDSAYWRVDQDYYYPVQFPCHYVYYFHYYISGDTLINAEAYKKINSSFKLIHVFMWNPTSPTIPPPTSAPGGYVGALRDDPPSGKVWFVFKGTTTVSLLYDYNLVTGDTLKGCLSIGGGFNTEMIVASVDSVLLGNQYRKRWIFNPCNISMSGNYITPYIIEGIGSSAGLIEPLCTYAIDWYTRYLVCVKDSSGTVFTSGYNSPYNCNLILALNDPETEGMMGIYPNPFSDRTRIEFGKVCENATLTVINLYGQIVKQIEHINGESILLQRDHLGSGMYLIQLQQDHQVILSDKMVVSNH